MTLRRLMLWPLRMVRRRRAMRAVCLYVIANEGKCPVALAKLALGQHAGPGPARK